MTITRIVLTNLVGFAAANFLPVANIRDFKLNNFFEKEKFYENESIIRFRR